MKTELKQSETLRGLALMEYLCGVFGPSGCEDQVREAVKAQALALADSASESPLGNLILKINGTEPEKTRERIMLSAHMDEVGMMISHIDDDGYLYFQTVGGIDSKVLSGRRIIISDEEGAKRLHGVIASKAIHMQGAEERKKATRISDMYIDIGATSREEAEKYVSIGDFATFDSGFVRFGDGQIKSKAIDDRLGCSVLIDVMRTIREEHIKPKADLYFAFTVREEVGFSGAVNAAYEVRPTRAMVIESTAVADISGTEPHKRVGKLGAGGVISLADRSTVYLREATDALCATAERNGIPYQVKKYVSGGNDAGHIHKAGTGIPVVALSCPSRYIHSASNVIHKDDYDSIYRLALCYALSR